MTTGTKWLAGLNTLLGLYLIVAPFAVVDVSTAGLWNDVIVGAIIAISSGYYYLTMGDREMGIGGAVLTTLAGLWMIVAPFVLGIAGTAGRNNIIVGILVTVFAVYMYFTTGTTRSTTDQETRAN